MKNKYLKLIFAVIIFVLPTIITGSLNYDWVKNLASWVPSPDFVIGIDVFIRFLSCLIVCKLLYDFFKKEEHE